MKVSRLLAAAVLGLGTATMVRIFTKALGNFGELCDEVELGYSSANLLPIAGQGFPDTSGVESLAVPTLHEPSQRPAAKAVLRAEGLFVGTACGAAAPEFTDRLIQTSPFLAESNPIVNVMDLQPVGVEGQTV